ncbi:MAG: hypothetical protein HRT89_08110 [Lentisphaeria bacterium]|nr:hypothetical protein [Lentisphaeria bacterium]
MYTHDAFLELGEATKAQECLELAYRFGRTLSRVQLKNGNFPARFRFPDLKAEGHLQGTVNPWVIQLWETANRLESHDPKKAAELKKICSRYAVYLTTKEPSVLSICNAGADEGGCNYYTPFSYVCLCWLIRYLDTGKEVYAENAKQTYKMAFLTSQLYIDQPQNSHWVTGNPAGFSTWYEEPELINQGGFGKMEGLFLKKYLDYDLGQDLSAIIFADTLAGRLLPDGGITGLRIDVPGYQAHIQDHGETLNYLHLGVYANYYLSGGF